jgi:8-amino-7-oxononanoate synthase
VESPTDVFAKVRRHPRGDQFRLARAHGLLPFFREVEGEAGPVVVMEGAERVMLGSNNYLGLTSDPRVRAAARRALDAYGSALTGSRLLNGTVRLHALLEEEIAGWLGAPAALVFTTGYQANVGVLGTLLAPGDTVVSDAGNHASLLDGGVLSGARVRPFGHARLDRLDSQLRRARADGGGVLVAVDGVFSMEGDVPDLVEVVRLCRLHGARLLVDEAHAVGALGPTGAGAAEALGVAGEVDLRTGTFSKSLASCGGFVAGPADVVEYLRIESRSFLFTASAVPAALGAALEAVRICRSGEGAELFARVLDNAERLRAGLRERGWDVSVPRVPTPIVSLRVGEDWRALALWRRLYEEGVYVNAALYPAVPRGGALLRASAMATHRLEHLDRALEIFERVGRRAVALAS